MCATLTFAFRPFLRQYTMALCSQRLSKTEEARLHPSLDHSLLQCIRTIAMTR